GEGWFHDTRQMLHEINSEYVFFWIEDHICLSGASVFNGHVKEMHEADADYLMYSQFHSGAALVSLEFIEIQVTENLIIVDYTVDAHKRRLEHIKELGIDPPTFIISVLSILKIGLFRLLIRKNDPFFKRWPKNLPFDFEKTPNDTHWLPLRYAFCRNEFFASVDDDQECPANPSLISRGLYENRTSRSDLIRIRNLKVDRGAATYTGQRMARLINRLKNKLRWVRESCNKSIAYIRF
ncbi:MAG: hypothetical protein D4R39_05025, partial [Methylophilaceae bacterium]